MDKAFLEELRKAKSTYETSLVCYFNDGVIRKDLHFMDDNLEKAKRKNEFYLISEALLEQTKRYGSKYDFDTIKMDLLLGLIYDAKDVDKDDNIKENAEPINGMLRFYTGTANTYLNGEQTNNYNSKYSLQSYITFDNLMSSIKQKGLKYDGPKSFEELKERILNNEVFEITISASSLNKEERKAISKEVEEEVIEETPVKKESKILSLFKR